MVKCLYISKQKIQIAPKTVFGQHPKFYPHRVNSSFFSQRVQTGIREETKRETGRSREGETVPAGEVSQRYEGI